MGAVRGALGAMMAALLAVEAAGACGAADAYACSTDTQCIDDGQSGFCETSGYCSFGDAMCESGRRYGSLAPAELAGQCTSPQDEPTGVIDPSTSGPMDDDTSESSVDPSATMSTSSSTSPIDPTTTSGEESTSPTDRKTDESSTSGPIEPTCAVSFTDDFEDGVIAPAWEQWVCENCTTVESNGHVAFSVGLPVEMEWPSAGLYTAEGPIAGGYVRAELVPFSPPLEFVGVWLTLFEEKCELQIAALESALVVRSGAIEMMGPDIATDEPLWLQIRVDTDAIAYWEWSSDGMAWELVHSEPAPCNVALLRGSIFAGGQHQEPMPITREVESFERCDPL